LSSALQAEQLAVYGYDSLGPKVAPGSGPPLARTCELAHRDLVTSIQALLMASPTPAPTPPSSSTNPSALAGSLPLVAVDDATARQLAVRLEEGCASAWRYVLARLADAPTTTGSTGSIGLWAVGVGALADSAVRAVRWRQSGGSASPSVPFPGI
jgi:Domain of unknown function (DUF4439)